ncbi:MAG: hypothetical protein C5B51_13420 [Terriglobia bacterium]|nr:MAG: hypothetical protein C5B51_13420 [Terriglobia bacterium]
MEHLYRPKRISTRVEWASQIPDRQWEVFERVMREAAGRKIRFALGGAFALAAHTGFWRDTKDLDLYVPPEYRDRMIALLNELGLKDYYEQVPYDRWWIYRSYTTETIVDVIWAMANHRAQIDELWMSGPEAEIRGRQVRILPPEAMVWDKLYIMQRDRCDWPDVMNMLYAAGEQIDWEYLVWRMGEDTPLLAGALSVFRWFAPGKAQTLPCWIWQRLNLPPMPPGEPPEIDRRRVSLLDTRCWFGPDRRN